MGTLVNRGPHRQRRRRSSPIGTGLLPETMGFAALADRLAAMSAAHSQSARDSAERLSDACGALLEALAKVRGEATAHSTIDLAARQLCGTGVFDRVMLSHIRGSLWIPQAIYAVTADGRVVLEIDCTLDQLEIPLASPLIEAEVVRRRLPALVQDAQHEPRAYLPLLQRTATREYAVAPVAGASTVVALLHVDNVRRDRPMTTIDRDLLRMFADGVGVVFERVGLAERAEDQRHILAEACEATMRTLDDPDAGSAQAAFTVSAVTASAVRSPASSGWQSLDPPRDSSKFSRLTTREREVLRLLASGATNAELADRLTVAESTVKSHVKHILHKLAARNRAAAIAWYLREYRIDERRQG